MNRHTVGAVPMGRAQTALILPCLVSIDLGTILRPRREASSERPEKLGFVGYPASVARSRASKLSSCASIHCLSIRHDCLRFASNSSKELEFRKHEISLELPFRGSFRLLHTLPH